MAGKNIEALLWEMFEPVAAQEGFALCDTTFSKEGHHWYVRIYIDKAGGVTIDDCELMSRKAGALLDERDPIAQSYILEVSSPGLDRALKRDADYEKYKGRIVDIKLYKAIENQGEKQKMFQGTLQGLENGIVSIKDEAGMVMAFDKKALAFCKLAVFLP